MKTISIAGCGWLGAPLARNLLAEGYKVKGSTTQTQKKSVMKDVGILPYLLTLTPQLSRLEPEDFFETELLIINIPPKTNAEGQDYHPQQIEALASEIRRHRIGHCIYISSTSIYQDADSGPERMEEDVQDPPASGQPAIRQAEQLLQATPDLKLTILRCGGLMGYDRIPGKHFAGQKNLSSGAIPVNYIHRDDLIKVVLEVLQQDYWNQVLNVVAPQHPTRKEVYLQNAARIGFEPPTFAENRSREAYKVVSCQKLLQELKYDFIYPDPLAFFYRQ
jgi:nucleoside-diphosphate-sugar epimerase